MTRSTILKRADGTGYIAVFVGSDYEAVAVGNGFTSTNPSDPNHYRDVQSRNAITHARASADIAFNWGQLGAELAGNWKEATPNEIDSRDEYRDQYGNEVGRRITEWLENWLEEEANQSRTYTDEQKQKFLDDLVMDAYDSEDLIWDLNNDPRLDDFEEDPSSYQNPANDVSWDEPSEEWQDSSQGRDYSMSDNFSENPIGLAVNIPISLWNFAETWVDKTFDSLGDLFDSLTDNLEIPSLPSWLQGVLSSFNSAKTLSPLVLDLDGDGIELVALNATGSVYWDIDNDGMGEASAWTAGGDGLLCIDLNSDGVINNQAELFGNTSTYANGFLALAAYDSNTSGTITSADTDFGDLLVWIDTNADGYSQSGELHSLSSLGITSINLGYSNVNYTIAGNEILQESTFTINGNTRTIVDAWFAYDNVNTAYNGEYELDIRTLFMPSLRGYGNLPDLHIAMSLDETLLEMVAEIATEDVTTLFSSAFDIRGKMEAILYRWADVDSVSPTSRGSYIDARKLEFLEELMGEEWSGLVGPDPNSVAGESLDAEFNKIVNTLLTRIFAQIDNTSFLLPSNTSYDIIADDLVNAASIELLQGTSGNDSVTGDSADNIIIGGAGYDQLFGGTGDDTYIFGTGFGISSYTDLVQEYASQGTDTIVFAGLNESDVYTWAESGEFFFQLAADANSTGKIYSSYSGSGVQVHVERIVFSDATWDLATGYKLNDSSASHELRGYTGNDILNGNGGNDTLYGHGGNDTLNGGAGFDQMMGGTGDDTYVFEAGFGISSYVDLVQEYASEGTDTIVFAGLDASDVYTWAESGEFYFQLVSDANSTGKIYSSYSGSGIQIHVEQMVFDDTTWDLTTGYKLNDSSASHELRGYTGNDILNGNGGNDTLYGHGGNDTLNGGAGFDQMMGGTGNDTYVFEAGFGISSYSDSIYEYSGEGTDTVDFKNLDVADVYTWADSYGLWFQLVGDSNSVGLINGSYSGSGIQVHVEQMTFDDATWDLTTGYKLYDSDAGHDLRGYSGNDVMHGHGGSDYLYGHDGNDILYGGSGSDYLTGGDGADTYGFEAASVFDASDTIYGFNTGQNDEIDVSDVLDGFYNPLTDLITDFVQITTSGADSILSIDQDGTANGVNFVQIATISSVTGLTDEQALVTSGNLIAA
jgi:Ca2+-binding RTX toxin-like protein